jgi:hypothetical protein
MGTVEFDHHVYHPELGALRDAVARDDWEAVESYAETWRPVDPGRLSVAAWVVARSPGAAAFLERHAPSRRARTLRAAERIRTGWEIRTSQRADQVTEEQWAGFRAHLVAAEQELIELAATDPTDSLTACLRLTSARGLGLGVSECQRRFAHLAGLAAEHPEGQSAHLQDLAPKWYGSTDLMFGFARECLAQAPGGSSAVRLIAQAQLEQWLELDGEAGVAFLKEPTQHHELLRAASQSVLHDDYEGGIRWVTDHSYFAVVHSLAERHGAAAVHFEALGDVADEEAWNYFHDPRKAHRDQRYTALGK